MGGFSGGCKCCGAGADVSFLIFSYFSHFYSKLSIQYDSFGPLLRRGPAETTCSTSSRFVKFFVHGFLEDYAVHAVVAKNFFTKLPFLATCHGSVHNILCIT